MVILGGGGVLMCEVTMYRTTLRKVANHTLVGVWGTTVFASFFFLAAFGMEAHSVWIFR